MVFILEILLAVLDSLGQVMESSYDKNKDFELIW